MTTATMTVKGGLYGDAYGLTTLDSIDGKGANQRVARRALAAKGEMALRARMLALDGVVAGSAASKTLGRIAASDELGGVRTVETETINSGNTVAGDVTLINANILAFSTKTTFGASPPANLDGNPLGTR